MEIISDYWKLMFDLMSEDNYVIGYIEGSVGYALSRRFEFDISQHDDRSVSMVIGMLLRKYDIAEVAIVTGLQEEVVWFINDFMSVLSLEMKARNSYRLRKKELKD